MQPANDDDFDLNAHSVMEWVFTLLTITGAITCFVVALVVTL